MSVQQVQHSDYQQLASRIAELSKTLEAMESRMHKPVARNTPASPNAVVETPLAIAAG